MILTRIYHVIITVLRVVITVLRVVITVHRGTNPDVPCYYHGASWY